EGHLRQRKQCKVGVRHAAHRVVQKRRLRHLRPRIGTRRRRGGTDWNRLAGGKVRIAQQIVVEVLAVTAEQAGELVELALGKVQLGNVVRIAAEPGGKGFQVIDEGVLCVRQRAEFKGVAQ